MNCSCNNHKPCSCNHHNKPCSCNHHKHSSCDKHNSCDKHHSCDKHNKRSPDLKFYYNDDNTISSVSNITFGTSLIETIQGVITDKSAACPHSKPIGNFLQYKLCSLSTNNTAFVSNVFTFYLKCGNIQCQPVGIQPLNSQDNYSLPPNITKTYRIINGTEQYLNSTGYVVLQTFDNLERLVRIYFKTVKKPHSVFEI
jgi:hypothetical protein